MIVRLKGKSLRNGSPSHPMFQFYDSPIKSLPAPVCLSILYGFNSMIVRLKDQHHILSPATSEWFQFYDSPIKSTFEIDE